MLGPKGERRICIVMCKILSLSQYTLHRTEPYHSLLLFSWRETKMGLPTTFFENTKQKKGQCARKLKKKKHGEDWEEDKKKPKGNQIKIEEWEAES